MGSNPIDLLWEVFRLENVSRKTKGKKNKKEQKKRRTVVLLNRIIYSNYEKGKKKREEKVLEGSSGFYQRVLVFGSKDHKTE